MSVRFVLVLAVTVLVAASCATSKPHEGIAAELVKAGFLTLASPQDKSKLTNDLEHSPKSGVFDERARRFIFADAEELAEGGVGPFLDRIRPILRRLGVNRFVARDHFRPGEAYDVTLNGRRVTIYSASELAEDGVRPGIFWGLAATRTVNIVNDLLSRAGSPERAWGYQGGNDFGVFLLTPKLQELVAAVVHDPRDEPYAMTDSYPSFGQQP